MEKDEQILFILDSTVLMVWLGLFGTQIELGSIIRKFKEPKGIILGLVLQTIFLPAWTSLLLFIFGTSSSIAIAFLVVSCSPGGMSSNMWCLFTQSDLALSVAITTCSTFISAGTMPLNLYLWGKLFEDSTNNIPIQHVLAPAFSIIIGCGSGIYLRYTRNYSELTLKRINCAAICVGLIIIVSATVKIYTDDKPKFNLEFRDYLVSLFMNGTTLLLGAGFARVLGLTKPEAVSVGYEVSTQNLSIPLIIIYNSFSKGQAASIISVIFVFGVASFFLNIMYHFTMVKLGWTNRNLIDGVPCDVKYCDTKYDFEVVSSSPSVGEKNSL